MIEKISINAHSSIRIELDNVLYFDPFHITKSAHDADVIFITHEHFDHFSPEDIAKIAKPETKFILPESMAETARKAGIPAVAMIPVVPSQHYTVNGIDFDTVPAYNIGKPFHPQANRWVGYIVEAEGTKVYVAGDTDALPENASIRCDIAILPVGGKYTMDAAEAAAFAVKLDPQIAVPSHYGDIAGNPDDGKSFVNQIGGAVQTRLLIGNK